jgi:hypothetical protein
MNIQTGPSFVTGRRVASLASSFHPPIDRVRFDTDDRLVGIAFVRQRPDRTGGFFLDRRLAVLPTLRVVVPDA